MNGRTSLTKIGLDRRGSFVDCLLQGCSIRGMIQATESAWQGIDAMTNEIAEGPEAVDLPPEDGPFKFVPDQFTRKQ